MARHAYQEGHSLRAVRAQRRGGDLPGPGGPSRVRSGAPRREKRAPPGGCRVVLRARGQAPHAGRLDRHDAAELGVDSRGLRRMVDDGSVQHVARGLYHLAAAEPTEHYTLAAVCARVPGAIVCLLSALSVHCLGRSGSPSRTRHARPAFPSFRSRWSAFLEHHCATGSRTQHSRVFPPTSRAQPAPLWTASASAGRSPPPSSAMSY